MSEFNTEDLDEVIASTNGSLVQMLALQLKNELAKNTALTSQLESVVAENAALKAAVTQQIDLRAEIKKAGRPPHADFWVQSICEAEEKVNRALEETPVTDSFLAEVRASGVEMAMEHMQSSGSLTFGDCYISLNEFAAKLRQEAAK